MSSRARRFLQTVLTLLPAVVLVYLVLKYKVDVPQGDDWDFIRLIEKSYQRTLAFTDLWAQHGAQRQIFPKALLLLNVHWTRWDVTGLLLLNVALTAAAFLALVFQVRETERQIGDSAVLWLIPLFSVCLFSLAQYQNWLWEGRVGKMLALGSVVSSMILLATPPIFRWGKIGWAGGLGVLSSYSYSPGLLLWPLGGWILSFNSFRDPAEKRNALRAWALVGGAVFFFYFFRFHTPAGFQIHRSSMTHQPLSYLGYVLTYLGSPLSNHPAGAFALGVSGLALFGLACRRWTQAGSTAFQPWVPYASLGLFAVGSALLTGLGRVGYGPLHAMNSRYIAFGQFLWLANLVFLFGIVRSRAVPGRSIRIILARAALLLVGLLVLGRSVSAVQDFRRSHHRLVYIQQQIRAPSRSEEFYRSMRLRDPVRRSSFEEGIEIIRKRCLSAFRHGSLYPPSRSQ